MKKAPLLGLLTACVICLVAVRGNADEAVSNLLRPVARGFFEQGVSAYNAGNWGLAIGSFERADQEDPNALQIWFNLAKAESKVPGYEIRADALLKAYLLRQPHTPQREAIDKLRHRLEDAVRERIRLILAGITGPAVAMPELCDKALLRIAEAQLRAGLYAEAAATVIMDKAKPSGCARPASDMAGLVMASALGGNIAITELYEAKLDAWLASRPPQGDETELSLEYEEGNALLPLYAMSDPNPAVFTTKEARPYAKIMALYNHLKAQDAYGRDFGDWYPISAGADARLSACMARRQGWALATVREYLLRARNAVILAHNSSPRERDPELVRFAVVFYLLKQQDAALATLEGISDSSLRAYWSSILAGAYAGSTLPTDDVKAFADAFWSKHDYQPGVRTEVETLMCLNQQLGAFELHKLGTEGFTFSRCYLGPPGTIKRPGQDTEIMKCVDVQRESPNGTSPANYSVLDGMLDLANGLSDGLHLVR